MQSIANEWGYLTQIIPGIGGKIKSKPQDFQVKEIPLYTASGVGEHLYLHIEKCNISTMDVVQQLSYQLQIHSNEMGYAGRKDSYAVAQQYFSIPVSCEFLLDKVQIPGVSILSAKRHSNKLRIGHLSGNRFSILIRDIPEDAEKTAKEVLEILQKRGVPNYFGEQRFGVQSNTHSVGKAMLLGDPEKICDAIFQTDFALESSILQKITELYKERKYREAMALLPSSFSMEKLILKMLSFGSDKKKAIQRIPFKIQKFYLCAYQSVLFNRTLASRLESLDKVWKGDLAVKHPGNSVFLVDDVSSEQKRCDMGEISPSGPMFGYKMIEPQGEQGEREAKILQEEGISPEMFRAFHLKGERRSYRFSLKELALERSQDGLWLSFVLPKGCYATIVLREIMKVSSRDLTEEIFLEEEEKK